MNSQSRLQVKNMSCVQCRRSKRKCDRMTPCTQCRIHGKAAECIPTRRTVVKNDKLTKRNANKLELPESTGFNKSSSTVGEVRQLLGTALSKLDNFGAEGSTNCFQHQTGHLQNRSATHTLPDLYSSALIQDSCQPNSWTGGIEPVRSRIESFNTIATELLNKVGPTMGQSLVKYYFASLHWLTRVLDSQNSLADFLLISRNSAHWVVYHIKPPRVCCYLAVLGVALQFAPKYILDELHLEAEQSRALSEHIIQGCRKMFWHLGFIYEPNVELLACSIIMGLYSDSRSRITSISMSIGSQISLAQSLGCHRLDDPLSEANLQPAISTVVERELKRRIYWYLIYFDWVHSTRALAYSIQPTQIFTRPLYNTVIKGHSVMELESYAETTFWINQLKYVDVCRQITDATVMAEEGLNVPQTNHFASLLHSFHNSTPSCLKYLEDPRSVGSERSREMEKCMLEITYQNIVLRLHRLHHLQGYRDSKWSFASSESISAANRLVDVLIRSGEAFPELLRYYLTIDFALGAVSTLMVDVFYRSRESFPELEKIARILDLMEDYSKAAMFLKKFVNDFSETIRAVQSIFTEEENMQRMSEASGERQLKLAFRDILRQGLLKSLETGKVAKESEPPLTEQGDHLWSEQSIVKALSSILEM